MATKTSPILEDTQLRVDIDRSLRHPVMFFFTSGAAWLAVSLVLGILASAKTHSPDFLSCFSCFNVGRTMPAHMSTLIYGWGAQAAFGVILWLMSRLSRQECKKSGIILAAGHAWNGMVGLGTLAVLAGEGTGVVWMAFPKPIMITLVFTYFLIGIWAVIAFRVRRGGHIYISQWYLLAALFWFPWVLISGVLFSQIYLGEGHPLMITASTAWYRSALMFLFFTPVAAASAYYIAPKVTGRPVYSYSLAIFGFWALAIIGPWAGLQRMMGTPIPSFIQFLSAGSAILLVIPAIALFVNIIKTAKSNPEAMAHSPSLRFTVAGAAGMLVFTVMGAMMSLPSSLQYTQFSTAQYGLELTGLLGFFSMCMFGAIYFIVPRITNREWISASMISQHFWLTIYGVAFIAIFYALLGGFMHGYTLEQANEPIEAAVGRLYPYAIGLTTGFVFLLIATFFFCCHLLLMWLRLGRRSNHPTLLASHAPSSPHGPEGDLEKLESMN
jgi:cytochrome c oxidase cbb3-type subunit I